MNDRMKQFESLRPLIELHFDFLISKYSFAKSEYTVGNVKNKSCAIRYTSNSEPSLKVRVGAWFPDFVMELYVERNEGHLGQPGDSYGIEEINRALNGAECPKLLNHSCYSYDEEIIDEVLQQMAALLSKFLEQVRTDESRVFEVLRENRRLELERYAKEVHNLQVHRVAQAAWDQHEYAKYLHQIARLTEPPNAIDQRRIYLAMKEYGNHSGGL